ncbi:MAG: Nif3-like dinuclear metal center hexameric protein [SAR324 cluster bacterium]|nr:Nif3-like dinuclear metal center hexameric protein [SAR324 cluster bacterium]
MKAQDLEKLINGWLQPENYRDYCPNGLQLDSSKEIKRIALAVSLTSEIIEKAADQNADAILCHHGLFWDGADLSLVGQKYERVKALIKNDLALLAYHLPLDYHPELGNSVQLAKVLGFANFTFTDPKGNIPNLLIAEADGILPQEFEDRVTNTLDRKPLMLKFGPERINKIGIMTGGAQKYFLEASKMGIDCYLTGEASEQTYAEAGELGLHYCGAGHYASEQYGVQALGKSLSTKGFDCFFIPSENPI